MGQLDYWREKDRDDKDQQLMDWRDRALFTIFGVLGALAGILHLALFLMDNRF